MNRKATEYYSVIILLAIKGRWYDKRCGIGAAVGAMVGGYLASEGAEAAYDYIVK